MNIIALLRQAWRITWTCWPLWVINLGMMILFMPAVALGGALGGLAALVVAPLPGRTPAWLTRLQSLPAWAWLVFGAAALLLLVVLVAASWTLQAAAARGAALAAEHGRASLDASLSLGWTRLASLLKLALTFGVLLMVLALAPPLLILMLSNAFPLGLPLLEMVQAVLLPLNTLLGVMLLLVMLSITLEDTRPRAAFRQAWRAFRAGWWGFLLVFGLSSLPGIALSLLLVPLAVVLGVALVIWPRLGMALGFSACAALGPLALLVALFTAVFTFVLYTLVYRSASARS